MSIYVNEYSSFPQQQITLHHYKNVDDSIADVINEINTLRSQGLYNQAARIIQNNSDTLSQYIVDAASIRTLEEEIYNTQVYAKRVQQCIYEKAAEPEEAQQNDVWLGGD